MKKLMSLLLVLMMVTSLAACGTDEQVGKAAEEVVAEDTEEAAEVEAKEVDAEEALYENLFPAYILDETETSVTYLDTFGKSTTITKMPKKTVVLYNSLLGLWYHMGGESMAKVKGTSNVPEEAAEILDLGSTRSISLEAVVALEPELVIIASNVSTTVEMAPNLEEMGIETMIIDGKYRSYDRFKENAYLFSKVLGTEDLYHEKTEMVIAEVEAIIDQATVSEVKPRVAPIFATSKSMSIETDIAQIGEIVTYLGGENIYGESDLAAEGETRIPFSIEAIVTQNPEVILISTMGSEDKAKAFVDGMIEENPVWNEVDAVKNGRVHYLDKDLSVYKPNQRYAEAFMMVAELLYPELFSAE